nr:MAG TPA: hypothetical protein [Caudoviricetes sp.]
MERILLTPILYGCNFSKVTFSLPFEPTYRIARL